MNYQKSEEPEGEEAKMITAKNLTTTRKQSVLSRAKSKMTLPC